MEHIHNTQNTFNFDNVVVNKPLSIQNGNFFMKVSKNGIPLYVQTPKCRVKKTKQDVQLNNTAAENNEQSTDTLEKTKKRSTKRNYCDFIVANDEDHFLKWFEDLEHHIQEMVYRNHGKWFDVELELEDIEMSFNPTLKCLKNNKTSILRTNLPNLEKTVFKIYDEDERELLFDDLDDSMDVMSILEIQGIKYSARSFQIDIELKQLLVMKNVNIFEKCILKSREPTSTIISPTNKPLDVLEKELKMESVVEAPEENIVISREENIVEPSEENIVEPSEENIVIETLGHADVLEEEKSLEEIIEEPLGNNELDCQEIELELDEIPEGEKVEIKERNAVYYEMYKDARRKAKVARDLALSSYLEAKRIKTTYMLDDIIDSDDSSVDADSDSSDSEDDETEQNDEVDENENTEENENTTPENP